MSNAPRSGAAPTPPADWLEVLEESERDVAAGRTVPSGEVHTDLDAAIAHLERVPAPRT